MLIRLVKKIKRFPNQKSYFDIGLAILRPILSFFVIMTHCHNYKLDRGIFVLFLNLLHRFEFHVPIFFLMAFYFSHKTLISKDYKKKVERLKRLIIPYFLWPIIYFFLNKFFMKFFKINDIPLMQLRNQFLCGYNFMIALWFQCNLILITIFYMLIILIFKRYANLVLTIISIEGLICQYNGTNNAFFSRRFPNYQRSFGKILEMFPYSVAGFLFASLGIIKGLKRANIQVLIATVYFLYFLGKHNVIPIIKGYSYTGFKLCVTSIGVFICFAMFPSEAIKNKNVVNLIKILTKHTGGVYYCHMIVHRILKEYIKTIRNRTIKGCFIIYVISYIFCLISSFFFGKTVFRHLFE